MRVRRNAVQSRMDKLASGFSSRPIFVCKCAGFDGETPHRMVTRPGTAFAARREGCCATQSPSRRCVPWETLCDGDAHPSAMRSSCRAVVWLCRGHDTFALPCARLPVACQRVGM